MRRFRLSLVALGVALLVTGAAGASAGASTGEVVVFGTEVEPLTTYENPAGCYKLPPTAHVLINRTSAPVHFYADPFCMSPSLVVQPGYGSHVAPGSGSFSLD